MNNLEIILSKGSGFQPGDDISGSVRWEMARRPDTIELSLCWATAGKGTPDREVVERIAIESPLAFGQHEFTLKAPESPYSFSGRLISIQWRLEARAVGADAAATAGIVISPTAKEIDLSRLRPEIPDATA